MIELNRCDRNILNKKTKNIKIYINSKTEKINLDKIKKLKKIIIQ